MWRFVIAVILAPVFWGALQLPGNLLLFKLFPEATTGAPVTMGYLILALLFACGYGLFSGFCSAWVAGVEARRIGLAAGTLLLAVGIAVQVSFWETVPLWWHLIFLISILPMTMLGARLRGTVAGS